MKRIQQFFSPVVFLLLFCQNVTRHITIKYDIHLSYEYTTAEYDKMSVKKLLAYSLLIFVEKRKNKNNYRYADR